MLSNLKASIATLLLERSGGSLVARESYPNILFLSPLSLRNYAGRNRCSYEVLELCSYFDALSRNKSERCESALKKLCNTWRGDIKKRARVALRKRRAFLNGDNS